MGTRCGTRCTDLPAGRAGRACSDGGHRSVDVGVPRDVNAGRKPVVEQVTRGLLQTHIDQLNGLGRDVDADPAPAQVLSGDARGSAAANGGMLAKRG